MTQNIIEKVVSTYRTGRMDATSTYLIGDPVVALFRDLNDQRERLQELKESTAAHIWFRLREGKIELMPLDGDLAPISAQIADMESKISINEKVGEEAVKDLKDLQMDVPIAQWHQKVQDLRSEIDRLERELHSRIAPYRDAARLCGADVEKVPEVIAAREEISSQVATLEAEAQGIGSKITKIQGILSRRKM